MIKFLDTNILLNPSYLDALRNSSEKFLISSETIKELENIKVSASKDSDVKFRARKAVRFLKDNTELYHVIVVSQRHLDICTRHNMPITPDNLIISSASEYKESEFVTNDLFCGLIAKDIFDLRLGEIEVQDKEAYKGYKTVDTTDEDLAAIYSNMSLNRFDCNINEYLLLRNGSEEIVDKLKWTGTYFEQVKYKQINNAFVGKIKPRNIEQELAFDLLQDDITKVKVLRGKAGSGKDFLMASTALDLIHKRKFDKIIWIRNNISVKNSKDIGFLPGTKDDKLKPFAMPFADHVGGEDGLDMLLGQGKIVIEHFGSIRGRDFKNSIIICSEAENMTKEHIQLLITRIGDGSELWINGDIKQVDDHVFENNNGLVAIVNGLKNNPLFGYVELQKTERSKVAELADLLD